MFAISCKHGFVQRHENGFHFTEMLTRASLFTSEFSAAVFMEANPSLESHKPIIVEALSI